MQSHFLVNTVPFFDEKGRYNREKMLLKKIYMSIVVKRINIRSKLK